MSYQLFNSPSLSLSFQVHCQKSSLLSPWTSMANLPTLSGTSSIHAIKRADWSIWPTGRGIAQRNRIESQLTTSLTICYLKISTRHPEQTAPVMPATAPPTCTYILCPISHDLSVSNMADSYPSLHPWNDYIFSSLCHLWLFKTSRTNLQGGGK